MHSKRSQGRATPNDKSNALKRSYSDANSSFSETSSTGSKADKTSTVVGSDKSPTATLDSFFQQPGMTYEKAPNHTPSVKTKVPQPFDMHLHPRLRLKKLEVLEHLPDVLSQYCDKVIQESSDFLSTVPPPPAPQTVPDAMLQSITNEDSLVSQYIQAHKEHLKVASGLLFKKGWKKVINMVKPDQDRHEAIADVLTTIDKLAETFLTKEQVSDIDLIRKHLLDVFVTFEFKSLVCGPPIFQNLLRLKGDFPWTACEERTNSDDSSTSCGRPGHRVGGSLLTTGRLTTPDSVVIQNIIREAQKRNTGSTKRPKEDLEPLSESKISSVIHLLQQASRPSFFWTQLVAEDCSVGILSIGNEEFVAFRDRDTQTLYISPLIECTKIRNPSHSKIMVACLLLGFNDAVDRARQMETQSTVNFSHWGYRLPLDKLSFYVKSNLGERLLKMSPQPRLTNHNEDIIPKLDESSQIFLRFHDQTISRKLGGSPRLATWNLQKLGNKGNANSQPKNDYEVFLDFKHDSCLLKKGFVVYLGILDKGSNIPMTRYYSRPLYVKMVRNAGQAKTLEKEYNNYRALESKGLGSAIVQTHGLFGAEGLPDHRFLLLESGGKTATQMTKANLKRHRKAYMGVLRRFHKAGVLIGNVEDSHILMDDSRRVTVISLSYISTEPPTKAEKKEEKISFKRAISYNKEPEPDSQSSDIIELIDS